MNIAFVHAHVLNNPEAARSKLTSEHFNRLAEGLRLYKSGEVQKIVVTCSHFINAPYRGTPMYQRSAEWLRRRGVPARDVLRVKNSRLTIEEIAGAAEILKKNKPKTVHVITSDYHMKRCLEAFRIAYPDVNFLPHKIKTGKALETDAHVNRDVRNMRKLRRARARLK